MAPKTRILKLAAPLPERRIAAVVCDADRRVREMLAAAQDDARRIREEAEAERESLRAAAAEEGRSEGRAEAAGALAAASAERDRLLASAEREVVSLVLAITRKVLGRELAAREGAIADLAARALAEVRERREVTLSVNPADAPAVRGAEPPLASALLRARLVVREDPGVARGSAVVDTEAGRLDAGIDAQLDRLLPALLEALGP
jgi:flagellar biosynthesis/type III secretory pathway protein FliH